MLFGRCEVLKVYISAVLEIFYDSLPKAQKKYFYAHWTMPTQISKDRSLNLGYWRSAVHTAAGSGLISIIVQKPSSDM